MGSGSKDKSLQSLKTGHIPAAREPDTGVVPGRRKLCFSFQLWRQIEHFGLGQQPRGWFHSLIERLHEMSNLDISVLHGDTSRGVAAKIRFHEINWKQRNCPIKLSDIDWIPAIIKSQPEFILQQFHISKSLGRVIGFLDKNNVFQIVLLDPLHNMQPSKTYDYRVRHTNAAECDFTGLVSRLRSLVTQISDEETRNRLLAGISTAVDERVGHALIVDLSAELISSLLELEFGDACASAEDVLKIGVVEVKKLLAN